MVKRTATVGAILLLFIWQAILVAGEDNPTSFKANANSYQADAALVDNSQAAGLPGVNLGAAANPDENIDLSSGSVRLNIPLESLTGLGALKGGIEGDLALNYSSLYRHERFASNKHVQTSVVGLGWNMEYSPVGITAVTVDHKQTATTKDDNYSLIRGGKVPLVSWYDGSTKKFRIGYEPNTSVTAYYKNGVIIGFKIEMLDGTIAEYGDYRGESATGEDPNNATWYTLRCGDWVGYGGSQTAPTQTWSRYPYRFELSRVRDAYGNAIYYKYSNSDGKTFDHSDLPAYTQDVWHEKISFSATDYQIEFEYADRETSEYGDQDQLFETFSRKHLRSVKIAESSSGTYNSVRTYHLDFTIGNSDASRYRSDQKKRLLTSIREIVPQKEIPEAGSERYLWVFNYHREHTGWENYLKSYSRLGGMTKEFVYRENDDSNVNTDLHAMVGLEQIDAAYNHRVVNDNYVALGGEEGAYIMIYNFEGKWMHRMEIDINNTGSGKNIIVDTQNGEPYCHLISLFGTPQYLVAVLAEIEIDSETGERSYRTRYIQSFHYDGAKWHKDERADIWCNDDELNPENTNGFWKTNNQWLKVDSVDYAIGNDFYVVATRTMRNVFASYWNPNTKRWYHDQNAAIVPAAVGQSGWPESIQNENIRWDNLQCGNDFFIAECFKLYRATRRKDEECNEGVEITDQFVVHFSPAMLFAPHWNRESKTWQHSNTSVFSWESVGEWYGNNGTSGPTRLKFQSGIVDDNHIITGISYCSTVRSNSLGRSRIYDIRWDETTSEWIGNETTDFSADDSWAETPEDQAIRVHDSYTRAYYRWDMNNSLCNRWFTDLKLIRNVVCAPGYFVYKRIEHFDDYHSVLPTCATEEAWLNKNYLYGNVFTGEHWKQSHIGNVGTEGGPCGHLHCVSFSYLRNLFAFQNYFVQREGDGDD